MTMWVFGYGSLLWNPGFEVAEKVIGRVADYHRSFCMWSIHHRGSVENPGLVLALDAQQGASCEGLALRVAEGHEAATLQYLRDRELISSAYVECEVEVALVDGRTVSAVTYVIRKDHEQYCAGMPLERQAQVIARAVGGRGPNTAYLYNTAQHLDELGLEDADLDWLVRRVRAISA